MEGYFYVEHALAEHWLWKIKPFSPGQAWLDLIHLAQWHENTICVRGIMLQLNRGDVGWSQPKLAARWGWTRHRVRLFLDRLESEQQIVQQKNNVTCVISITNYSKYQDKGQQNGQQRANKRPANGQQRDPNKEVNTSKERKEETDSTYVESCAEPLSAASPPSSENDPVLTFPVIGSREPWTLTFSKLQQYQQTYSALDVAAEMRKAKQWCEDNPSRRKTVRGMPAFLNRWLGNAQDSGKGASNGYNFQSRLTFDQQKTLNTIRAAELFGEGSDDET